MAEQVETVCMEAAEGHVGRIWGKKYERLWRSATGFFDWKNSTAYFSPLILYSYPQIRYSIHVPNDRYMRNDRIGGTKNAASAWSSYPGEHDLWRPSLPLPSSSSPWQIPGQRPSARNAARTVHEPCESESHRGGGITVFEYRVEIYAVRSAEAEMNRMAADGWRVIAVSPNIAASHGIVVTFERKK